MCVCADLRHFFGTALEIGPANENILVLHMHRQQYSRLATKVTLRCVSVCLCVFLLKNFATDFNWKKSLTNKPIIDNNKIYILASDTLCTQQ